ncbi:hypothetical protein D3C84_704680 [compost metagenome]
MIDGKLGQSQRLFTGGAQGNVGLRGRQSLLEAVLLTALPEHDRHAAQRHNQQQQAEVLPEPGGLGQPRVLGLQPLVVQGFQILGRDRPQRTYDDTGQFRFVAPRRHPQQLRQTDVTHHHQAGEFRLDRQAPQLRLIDHGIASLLAQQQLQCLTLHRHALKVQMRIVATQVVGDRAGHSHGHASLAVEFFQLHRSGAFLVADDQLRHSHVWIGKLPEAQTTGRLAQPRGDIDFTRTRGGFQLFKIRKIAPGQLDVERLGQPFHQLDIDPGQALQAAIVLSVGRLQHQPDTQLALLCQPLLLGGGQHGDVGRRRGCPAHQGKPQTADNPQAAKTHHRTLTH